MRAPGEETHIEMSSTPIAPLIAVTTSEVRASQPASATPEADPAQHEMVLGLKYLRAIEQAGGIPLVVPPLSEQALGSLLHGVDALCLSGGPDIDPVAYGDHPHERLGPTWFELDSFELALTRAADRRGMPILAICRGLQVLNVARGGSLHQHVPDTFGDRITHRQQEPGHVATHEVSVTESCRLAKIIGAGQAEVNSFHHQAISALGHGLIATGWAPDGVIESIEARDRGFTIGVQWHAEGMVARAPQAALFSAFVEAARGFRASAPDLEIAA
jgi:putative glutamine amidotransferase